MNNSTPTPTAPKNDFGDLVNLLASLTEAENELRKLEASLNQDHLAAVRLHVDSYKELQTKIGEAKAAIEIISARNVQWFEERKTLATPYGEVKRTTSTKLVIADETATIALIRAARRSDDFLETRITIRREVLETLEDEELRKFGVRRETTHNYKPEPAAIDLGKAVKDAQKSEGATKKTAKKAAATAAIALFFGLLFNALVPGSTAVAAPTIAAPTPPLAPISSKDRALLIDALHGTAELNLLWSDYYAVTQIDYAYWHGRAEGFAIAAYWIEHYEPSRAGATAEEASP